MQDFIRDLRFSARSLAKNRSFTAIVVVTLSLGIGATTTIFSVVNGVVLAPLPYAEAERLVHIRTEMTDGRQTGGDFSPYAMYRLNEESSSFEHIAGAYQFEVSIRDLEDRPIKTVSDIVTPGYFEVFGLPMSLGRPFQDEEYVGGQNATTVVLSHDLWQRAFNGDPSVVGASIPSGNQSFTVVGIASPDFDYPVGADLWVPWRPDVDFTGQVLEAVGRLRPGVSIGQAQAELDVFSQRFETFAATFEDRIMVAQDLKQSIVGDTSTTLFILLGAAGALLLVACTNVMNLLLSRGESRTREIALRAALGASPGRLIAQLVTESMALAAVGAILALAGSWVSLAVLKAVSPSSFPRLAEVSIDGTVLLFAVAATAATGLVFGLLPAFRLAAADIKSLMGGTARGSSSAQGGAVFSALVLAQTGIAVTLVIGAGLLIRSYERLQAADGGFRADSVLVTEVNLAGQVYPDYSQVAQVYEELIDRVEEIPGVRAAGVASELPLRPPVDFVFGVNVVGLEEVGDPPRARHRQLSPGAFEALGLEVVEGRAFTEDDRADVTGALILNETFARQLFGDESPLGRQIGVPLFAQANPLGLNHLPDYEVVGVVKDVRNRGLDVPAEPSVYLPQSQFTVRRTNLVVRVAGVVPGAVADDVRAAVAATDRTIPTEFFTMDDVVAESLSGARLAMLLLLAFGLSATTLAAVGIYGVISFTVTRRTGEMAIRSALGASRENVLWLSMSKGLVLTGIGLTLGILGAVLARQAMASQLYEISATDPMVMVAAPAFLGLVALLAIFVPALRSTRINLSHTLRTE